MDDERKIAVIRSIMRSIHLIKSLDLISDVENMPEFRQFTISWVARHHCREFVAGGADGGREGAFTDLVNIIIYLCGITEVFI